jgi:branched-chain amino acid transport system ATP-binding protein
LGLAPLIVREIFDIVTRINRETRVSMLLVEQNASIALQSARIGHVLEMGRIVMSDTTEALSQKEDVREFYLGLKDAGVRGKRRWKKRKTWR